MYDVPFNNLDGIKLEYSGYTDDWGYNLSASVGEFEGPAFGASIIGENVIILATEASYEWFKIRDVHGSGKTYLDLGASDRTNLQEAAAGLAFMRSVGFTDLEESFLSEQAAYYVTAGLRIGAWTPSITYDKYKIESEVKFQHQLAEVTASQLPDQAKAIVTGYGSRFVILR